MNVDRCLDAETLSGHSGWPPGDPRRVHLESCARCQSLLAALEVFEAEPDGVPQERLADARARLVRARRDWPGLGAPPPVAMRDAPPLLAPRRRWPWDAWGRGVQPALAAAALLAIAGVAYWAGRSVLAERSAIVLRAARGREGPPAERSVRTLTSARQERGAPLKWRAFAGADAYEVVLLDGAFTELARIAVAADTVLPLERFHGTAGPLAHAQYWQVTARRGGDVLAESAPVPLAAGPGR